MTWDWAAYKMTKTDPHAKRCATVQACNYINHCKYKHTLLSGVVQFFVPQSTGMYCDHYVPWMKPWGEGPVDE